MTETLPLTAEEEETLREHTATEDLWLSTDIWGGTMIRRLIATLDRALAATPPTEGLDAETLKQALWNVAKRHGVVKDPPPPLSVMRIYGYSTAPATMDAEIAREYAALRAASPTSED